MENGISGSAKCFVISAPSGAGKTTLVNRLIEDKQGVFFDSVSDTTRGRRLGEIDEIDYNFISVPEFQSRLENEEYLEWARVHENFYGTPRSPLLDAMKDGLNPLMVLDVQGYFQVRDNIPYDKLCGIFILPPNEDELIQRISGRGGMDAKILEIRLENAKKECAFSQEYKYSLTNDNLDMAYAVLRFIVEKEMETI
ncbi:MAG: guanylate kinase [Nanoarchaeota archaeon]|nr:guanylate kinase [Nanoarchaeota archaeon]